MFLEVRVYMLIHFLFQVSTIYCSKIRIASILAFICLGVYHVCEYFLVLPSIFYLLGFTNLLASNQIQVGILKRVLEEVEKVMNDFKTMLFQSMEDPQIDLTSVSFYFLNLPANV